MANNPIKAATGNKATSASSQLSAKDKKVVEYIKTYQKKGYSAAEIKAALLKSGVKEPETMAL